MGWRCWNQNLISLMLGKTFWNQRSVWKKICTLNCQCIKWPMDVHIKINLKYKSMCLSLVIRIKTTRKWVKGPDQRILRVMKKHKRRNLGITIILMKMLSPLQKTKAVLNDKMPDPTPYNGLETTILLWCFTDSIKKKKNDRTKVHYVSFSDFNVWIKIMKKRNRFCGTHSWLTMLVVRAGHPLSWGQPIHMVLVQHTQGSQG